MEIRTYLSENGYPEGWEKVFRNTRTDRKNATRFLKDNKIDYTPPADCVYKPFYITKPKDIKVVFFGMDPYFNGKADGLAFSMKGQAPKASLLNILKELKRTHGFEIPKDGNLEKWAERGIFLLNVSLTAKKGESGHHLDNWMGFQEEVIKEINDRKQKCVYVLLGNDAAAIKEIIGEKGICIKKPHPSPSNRRYPFVGCDLFKEIDEALVKLKVEPIDWNLS